MEDRNYYFTYINVQCLTETKYVELEKLIEKNCLLFLTETQMKVNKIKYSSRVSLINSMREIKDKKGGGFCILYRNDSYLIKEIKQKETKSNDILHLEMKIGTLRIRVILVYFSILDNSNKDRNEKIQREIENIVIENQEKLVILGDFNGHIEGLGYQNQDERGNMIINWLNNYNLHLMNTDDRCNGIETWERGNQKSTIDFVMINDSIMENIVNMKIDCAKEEYDLSDHNLITIKLKMKCAKILSEKVKIEYLSKKESDIQNLVEVISEKLENRPMNSMDDLNSLIKDTSDDILKKMYIKNKIGNDGIIEKPWMNEEIRKEIKRRKYWNRKRRNSPDEESYDDAYKKQKQKVQEIIRK